VAASSVSGTSLSKDAFLQLLVTQMRYQDPLQPMDNSQFLAQLAQFTALEQLTNLAQTENQVLQSLQVVRLGAVQQLIGTQVTVTDGQGQPVTGTVEAVKFADDGSAVLQVNGQTYPIDAVQSVGPSGAVASEASTTP
jgi:flagellar basal-body rod modification protein FlgD